MKVYKYRSNNDKNLEFLLQSSKFYFSAWNKMNDPMEGYFRYYEGDHNNYNLLNIVEQKQSIKICSFSLVPDDMLLWSHYSNNHKGVCIEVDIDESNVTDFSLNEVDYISHIPFIRKSDETTLTAKDILSHKLNDWRYEKEIRAFTVCNEPKSIKVGNITRVILGLDVTNEVNDIVHKAQKNNKNEIYKIVKAEFDFNSSKIIT